MRPNPSRSISVPSQVSCLLATHKKLVAGDNAINMIRQTVISIPLCGGESLVVDGRSHHDIGGHLHSLTCPTSLL